MKPLKLTMLLIGLLIMSGTAWAGDTTVGSPGAEANGIFARVQAGTTKSRGAADADRVFIDAQSDLKSVELATLKGKTLVVVNLVDQNAHANVNNLLNAEIPYVGSGSLLIALDKQGDVDRAVAISNGFLVNEELEVDKTRDEAKTKSRGAVADVPATAAEAKAAIEDLKSGITLPTSMEAEDQANAILSGLAALVAPEQPAAVKSRGGNDRPTDAPENYGKTYTLYGTWRGDWSRRGNPDPEVNVNFRVFHGLDANGDGWLRVRVHGSVNAGRYNGKAPMWYDVYDWWGPFTEGVDVQYGPYIKSGGRWQMKAPSNWRQDRYAPSNEVKGQTYQRTTGWNVEGSVGVGTDDDGKAAPEASISAGYSSETSWEEKVEELTVKYIGSPSTGAAWRYMLSGIRRDGKNLVDYTAWSDLVYYEPSSTLDRVNAVAVPSWAKTSFDTLSSEAIYRIDNPTNKNVYLRCNVTHYLRTVKGKSWDTGRLRKKQFYMLIPVNERTGPKTIYTRHKDQSLNMVTYPDNEEILLLK